MTRLEVFTLNIGQYRATLAVLRVLSQEEINDYKNPVFEVQSACICIDTLLLQHVKKNIYKNI
jgi:hypothetical protein